MELKVCSESEDLSRWHSMPTDVQALIQYLSHSSGGRQVEPARCVFRHQMTPNPSTRCDIKNKTRDLRSIGQIVPGKPQKDNIAKVDRLESVFGQTRKRHHYPPLPRCHKKYCETIEIPGV